jgi:hypothetical protein
MTVISAKVGSINRRIMVQASQGKSSEAFSQNKQTRAGLKHGSNGRVPALQV